MSQHYQCVLPLVQHDFLIPRAPVGRLVLQCDFARARGADFKRCSLWQLFLLQILSLDLVCVAHGDVQGHRSADCLGTPRSRSADSAAMLDRSPYLRELFTLFGPTVICTRLYALV